MGFMVRPFTHIAGALTGFVLLGACAFNPDNQPFASDLDGLEMIMQDEFTAVYARPETDLAGYTKVRVKPVQFWGNMEAFETIEAEDRARLKKSLMEALDTELGEKFELTDKAGEDVLDLSVRITNINEGDPATNVLSTAVVRFSLDVGQAAMQSELRDSDTDELLVAIQDEESARRFLNHRTYISRWRDVEVIFEGWAESLAEHIDEARTMMADKAKK